MTFSPATATPSAAPSPTNRPLTIAVPETAAGWDAARGLLVDYFDWLAPLAGVESVPAVQPSARDELADLANAYGRIQHRFLLARQGGLAVGIVGLRPSETPGTAELVRFYSRPAARGAGVGTALVVAALNAGTELDFTRIVLDTAPSIMPEAVRLYERHGFVRSSEPHGLPIDDGVRLERELPAH